MKNKNDIDPFSFLDKADKRMKTGSKIKNVGTAVGAFGGLILGGPVILAGKLLNSKTIVEIGSMAAEQTSNTGALIGQVAQGVVSATTGIVTKDKTKVDEGVGDLTQTAVTVGTGIVNGVKSTVKNGVNVYEGIRDGDSDKALKAAATIGKGLAVGAIGFGVADALGVVDVSLVDHNVHGDIHLADTHTVGDGVGIEHYNVETPGLIMDNHNLITAKSHVDSHYVHDYYREDGTHVHGYWRGGEDGYDATKYVTNETTENSLEAHSLSQKDFANLVKANKNNG
jgi:hypothetical protein